jgi:hypothetical protein
MAFCLNFSRSLQTDQTVVTAVNLSDTNIRSEIHLRELIAKWYEYNYYQLNFKYKNVEFEFNDQHQLTYFRLLMLESELKSYKNRWSHKDDNTSSKVSLILSQTAEEPIKMEKSTEGHGPLNEEDLQMKVKTFDRISKFLYKFYSDPLVEAPSLEEMSNFQNFKALSSFINKIHVKHGADELTLSRIEKDVETCLTKTQKLGVLDYSDKINIFKDTLKSVKVYFSKVRKLTIVEGSLEPNHQHRTAGKPTFSEVEKEVESTLEILDDWTTAPWNKIKGSESTLSDVLAYLDEVRKSTNVTKGVNNILKLLENVVEAPETETIHWEE